LVAQPRATGLVRAGGRPPGLPPDAVARPGPPGRTARGLSHQVQTAGGVGPAASRGRRRSAPAGDRRRLRLGQRRPTAGPSRRGFAPGRCPDPLAARCPPGAGAADPTAAGPAWTSAGLGATLAAAAPGRTLAGAVAGGTGVPVGPAAQGPLEGVVRPVACGRRRRGRQGGGGGSRRLSHTLYVGDPGGAAERLAAGGVVLCPLPPGRRLPRPEATPGLGRVPGLDAPADRAD